jgi:competence protein ComEA
MEEETKQKIYERAGIVLIAVILVLIGVILIKENQSEEAKFVPAIEDKSAEQVVKSAEAVKTGVISINKASVQELDRLPGIGEVLAQRIVDYRTEKGSFKTIEEIKNVSGIGDAKFNSIRELIGL